VDFVQTLAVAITGVTWGLYFIWTPSTTRARLWVLGVLLSLYVANRSLSPAVPLAEYTSLFIAILLCHALSLLLVPKRMRLQGRSYHNFGIKAYWTIFLLVFSIPMAGTPAGTYLQTPHRPEFLVIALAIGGILVPATYALKRATSTRLEFECVTAGLKNSLTWDFISAFCEELIFRGLLLTALNAFLPLHTAVILQASLFGVAHVKHGRPRGINGFSQAAVWGLLLGYLVHFSGSLLPAFVVHAAIIPFLRPFSSNLLIALKKKGSKEVQLFRCGYHGKMYLCDGETVRIDLDPVANEVPKCYGDGVGIDDVSRSINGRFPKEGVRTAFREIKTLESKGAVLRPEFLYRTDPPCKGKSGTCQ
jgi:membrane protease YdiL (CAAX protease family)